MSDSPAVMARLLACAAIVVLSGGCSVVGVDEVPDWEEREEPSLAHASSTFGDLIQLPEPASQIPVAVYGFRDRTGMYREAPQSNFSTAVTQGGGSLLVEALLDSGWFRPMEREGLQDLLTERRVARQVNNNFPSLKEARLMLEGGIIAYENNIVTGGAGARYFGIGASERYEIDQVTVTLRAVDVHTGEIINSVTTTQTLYSRKLEGDLFRFVRYQRLLEAEGGYARNEPRFLAVNDAISAAVIHLVVQGIAKGHWRPANQDDLGHPIIKAYLNERAKRRKAVVDELE